MTLTDRARRWLTRRSAYRACFMDQTGKELTRSGDIVMRDLARFCGAYQSTVKVSPISRTMDPLASAVAQGRREVWLRLQASLRLPDEAVLQLMEQGNE